jgi:hypothetical protein
MTKKQKEKRLNRLYSEADLEDTLNDLIYLTNPHRGSHTTEHMLIKAHTDGTLGTLLRRMDSTAFECAEV